MRELKFRVWDNHNKKMITQDRTDRVDKCLTYFETHIKTIVMQFIGLCDKNNKEIYGGDIVKFHIAGKDNNEIRIGVVTYSKRKASYMFKDGGISVLIALNIPTGLSITDPNPNFEVIGNIYENPEHKE